MLNSNEKPFHSLIKCVILIKLPYIFFLCTELFSIISHTVNLSSSFSCSWENSSTVNLLRTIELKVAHGSTSSLFPKTLSTIFAPEELSNKKQVLKIIKRINGSYKWLVALSCGVVAQFKWLNFFHSSILIIRHHTVNFMFLMAS